MPRTAERLRDLTAVAIAASTYVAQGTMSGHTPHDAGEITRGIANRQLIPPEWLTNQSGVLQTAPGTLHLRYSPSTLSVEVISMPTSRADGPAMLMRIPDTENTTGGPRYFESMHVDGILYPSPFAPIHEIVSTDWRERRYQTQLLVGERANQIQRSKVALKTNAA